MTQILKMSSRLTPPSRWAVRASWQRDVRLLEGADRGRGVVSGLDLESVTHEAEIVDMSGQSWMLT